MRALPADVSTLVSQRIGLVLQTLIWISAKNRTTGTVETMGLWSGDIDQTITVEGQERLYYGAGGLIEVERLVATAGLDVQVMRATLAPLAPEVEMLVRGYDARLAPAQIHKLTVHPRTRAVLGVQRLWNGWVDNEEVVSPTDEEPGRITLTIASNALAGTRGLALKKSDASQQLRIIPGGAPDEFAKYSDISGKVSVKWGTK